MRIEEERAAAVRPVTVILTKGEAMQKQRERSSGRRMIFQNRRGSLMRRAFFRTPAIQGR